MAPKGMDIDEVRDLIRYLEDQNDFFSDPFSRAGMGSGMFNAAAFQPTREYVTNPTPYKNILMGMAAQNPDTLEGLIADAIVNNGSPTSILVTLQNTDPEALKGLVPFTENERGEPVPDWSTAQNVINTHWTPYIEEQQSLTDYQAEMDPQSGQLRYYTETPSKAAERFTDLGLPLPTEQYSDQYRGQGPSAFREQNGFDPMLEQLRGQIGDQRSRVDGLTNRYEQKMTGMMAPEPERNAMFRQLLGDVDNTRSVAPGQVPSVESRSYQDLASDTGWTPESIALAQELGLVPQRIQDRIDSGELDPAVGEVAGGGGGGTPVRSRPFGVQAPVTVPAHVTAEAEAADEAKKALGWSVGGFIDPTIAAEKVWGGIGAADRWLGDRLPSVGSLFGGGGDGGGDKSWQQRGRDLGLGDYPNEALVNFAEGRGDTSADEVDLANLGSQKTRSTKALSDLIAEQELLRNERAQAFRDTVGMGSDAMQGASRAFALEDSGRTPLTDVLDALARESGVPSQFTPTYDPGPSGRGTSESSRQFAPKKQYLKADPDNPRYKLNRALAFQRYLNS